MLSKSVTASTEVNMAKAIEILIPVERIEKAILLIRGQNVMLDQNLAQDRKSVV